MPDPAAETVKFAQAGRSFWQRVTVWTLVTLGVLCLLVVGGWFGCRWWIRSKLENPPYTHPVLKDTIDCAKLAAACTFMDRMPDFVVYPILIDAVRNGPRKYRENDVALTLIEWRVYGGCQQVALTGGAVPENAAPVPGASEWVAKLPREQLEDLYSLSCNPGLGPVYWTGGTKLIRVLEPDNPRWQRPATKEEAQAVYARPAKEHQP